ncbi:MAG: hypothetical protein KTR14_01900 [Vampirovibrio sp.]|nr:hypothetical protein [Vampirovibrio sp.]
METTVNIAVLVNWIHLLAVIAWLGGTVFIQYALLPTCQKPDQELNRIFIKATGRFRYIAWIAMGIILLTGMMRVNHSGGMQVLAPWLHIKIGIAVLMIVLGVVSTLWIWPALSKSTTSDSPNAELIALQPRSQKLLKLYNLCNILMLLAGLIIIYMLSAGQAG